MLRSSVGSWAYLLLWGTRDATRTLEDEREVTISCAEGDRGIVYQGLLEYATEEIDLEDVPETQTKIMMNIASPQQHFGGGDYQPRELVWRGWSLLLTTSLKFIRWLWFTMTS